MPKNMQLILLTIYKLPYMEITTTFIMMTKQTVIYRGNDTVNMHHQIFYLKRKEKETLRTNLKNYFLGGGGWLGVGG